MDESTGPGDDELDVLGDETSDEKADETPDEKAEETSDETDETDEVDETDDESDDSESDDDEESEESEDSDEEDDDEDLEALGNRPSFRSLKKEFPDLKKKFPGVFEALGAERGYRTSFPTVKDAQAAAVRLEAVDVLENSILEGQPGLLLSQIKRTSGQVYEKFVDNFVDVLSKHDKEAYSRIAKPVFSGILRAIAQSAKARGGKEGENLERAVKVISLQAFNSTEVPDFTKRVSQEDVKLRQERQQLYSQQLSSYDDDINTRVGTRLYKMAEASIKDVKLDPYARKALSIEIADAIDDLLDSDAVHNSTIRNIRGRAVKGGFTEEFKSRTVRAYMERAQQLLPNVRRKKLSVIRSTGKGKPLTKRPSKEMVEKRVESKKPVSRSGGLDAQEAILAGK